MWKKLFLCLLTLVLLALVYKLTDTDRKSTWYGDLKISDDGAKVAFASGYPGESGAGIYILDLQNESWTLLIRPKRNLRSPIWSVDNKSLIAISSRGYGVMAKESEVIQIDLATGLTKKIFSSNPEMVLEKLATIGNLEQIFYIQRPFCDLQPAERCGVKSDLYLFNNKNKSHRRLTKIEGGFSRPQFVDEKTIIVQIPFYHLPNQKDQPGSTCGMDNIDNSIYQISFPEPVDQIEEPLAGDCSWKPLIRGALGTSGQPVLDKNKTRLLYISADTSKSEYVRSLYMRNLKTGEDYLVRNTDSTGWDFIDMTSDARYVVNLDNFRSKRPKVWWKDLKNNIEKEISPDFKKMTTLDLKNNSLHK